MRGVVGPAYSAWVAAAAVWCTARKRSRSVLSAAVPDSAGATAPSVKAAMKTMTMNKQ